jgi:manganese/zinc/iron transport system permease protein
MVITAAVIGAVGCLVGAALSALLPKLPAGAVIVTTIGAVFVVSMWVAPERGVFARWLEQYRLSQRIALQHLLRAIFEWHEKHGDQPVSLAHLGEVRSWSPAELRRTMRAAARAGWLAPAELRLTAAGMAEAGRLVRNHRLWELYLITHADIAPSHVDRDADQIEHVLGTEMVHELETLLAAQSLPASPHPLAEKRHE